MKRLATLIAMVLVLAACSGADEMVAPDEPSIVLGDGEGGSVTVDEQADPDAPSVNVRLDVVDDRQVIRQANIQLHAGDTRATYDEIIRLTQSVGGFVADATVSPTMGEDDQPDVSMTLRIPADQLNETMKAIKGLADEVVAESQGAQDVTEQFVDLEARLTNLEALEVELRALLEDVRQQEGADPQKLLTVFNELASVRGQIEQVQGQINHLSDLTALATLSVYVTQTPAAVPIVENPWAPAEVAKDALRSLVTALQGMADWLISFGLYTLPVLLLTLGIPVIVGLFVYRRYRGRDDSGGPPTPAPAES